MENTFRVKVKQATSDTWYYGDDSVVGKCFDVKYHNDDLLYEIVSGFITGCFLRSDCEIIPAPTNPNWNKIEGPLKRITAYHDSLNKPKTILEEAQSAVYGDRQADYGTVTENFGTIAKLWSAVLKHDVTPEQVGLCMVQVKVAREMYRPKRDNLVDVAGYAATLEKLSKGE